MGAHTRRQRFRPATATLFGALAITAGVGLWAKPAWPQDATWLASPGSNDFNTAGNWDPNTQVPTGTAFFDASGTTDPIISADTSIGGWTFNAGADSYFFTTVNFALAFTGAGIVVNGGGASFNNNNDITFQNSSTAGSAKFFNQDDLIFQNSSTAGGADITNNERLTFQNNSTAGSASIVNQDTTTFSDSSTAGGADITNNLDLIFQNTSTAGSASIVNQDTITFSDSSTAGSASIVNLTKGSSPSTITFKGSSTAGSADITNFVSQILKFSGTSTAGSANITNGGELDFVGSSTAGSATIVNRLLDSFGRLNFSGNSTAGSAAIDSDFIVDFSASDGPLNTGELTAGSLAGRGDFFLGANELTVGGNNRSTDVGGSISDCGLTGFNCLDGGATGGSLVKTGTGTFTLSGVNTYTGPTTVNQGTLVVNGSIVSDVTVNNGGMLGGTGRLGALTVASGGIYAPGNSIGTQTVEGNFTLASGATFEVETNAAGKSDKVIVNGTVNLTGATLRVLAAGGNYAINTSYTIIDNDGTDAVKGEFGTVTSSLAFLTPAVAYDGGTGNDVVLILVRNDRDFCDLAKTSNQCATAKAVAQFPIDDALYLDVLNLSEAEVGQAFDALSGEIHATLSGVLADDSRYVRDAILGRLMQATYTNNAGALGSLGAGGPQVASLDSQAMALGFSDKSLSAPHVPLAFWTRAFGAWADFDGNGSAATADRNLGGFISGMDAQVGGSWRVGLATGASFSNVGVDARYSSADVKSYHLGGYLGGMAGAFALRGGGMWAWNNIDTNRAVIFPGFYERQKASYGADTGQIFGKVAYPAAIWNMALEPFAGLAYVSVNTENFHEHGGALAALNGRGTDENVGYSTLGLRAATKMQWGAMQFVPHISAAWQHTFDDVTPDAALTFASVGIGFDITGVPLAEDSALIDAGLDFALSETTSAGVSYSGQFGDGVSDNGVKGRFAWLF